MKKYNFIVAYDISSPKRLQQLAKFLEKDAIRIQKSIFFYSEISKNSLGLIVDNILSIIDEKDDDVRVYQVDINRSISINSAIDLSNPLIIR